MSTIDPTQEPGSTKIKPLQITVLAGGPSAEREVSLESGAAVAAGLKRLGHSVTVTDVGPNDLSGLDIPADFVFIALHGDFGEDGTVQSELDRRGIPYSGSGVASSRLSMNKVAAKRQFLECGIPTPGYEVVTAETLSGLADRFETPAVVKPVSSGSSVDTSIPKNADSLTSAAEAVVGRYGEALVERFIAGPELTCAILGDTALPVCEIRPAREFYDYVAKYQDDDTQYLFDIALPQDLLLRVQELSLQAHQALGCEVFSRVDIMIEQETHQPYILELNTIPGFTSHSLVPKASKRVGVDFDQLCQTVVEYSLGKPDAANRMRDAAAHEVHAAG